VRAGLVPNLDPAFAPAVVAAVIGAVIVGVLLFVVGLRSGIGAAVGLLVVGALLGALIGLVLGGTEFDWRVASAIGIAVGALLWPILQIQAAKDAVDPKKRFSRLWPRETYETALETRAWLEQEWAKRRERLVKRS
jgi:MFS family permease